MGSTALRAPSSHSPKSSDVDAVELLFDATEASRRSATLAVGVRSSCSTSSSSSATCPAINPTPSSPPCFGSLALFRLRRLRLEGDLRATADARLFCLVAIGLRLDRLMRRSPSTLRPSSLPLSSPMSYCAASSRSSPEFRLVLERRRGVIGRREAASPWSVLVPALAFGSGFLCVSRTTPPIRTQMDANKQNNVCNVGHQYAGSEHKRFIRLAHEAYASTSSLNISEFKNLTWSIHQSHPFENNQLRADSPRSRVHAIKHRHDQSGVVGTQAPVQTHDLGDRCNAQQYEGNYSGRMHKLGNC